MPHQPPAIPKDLQEVTARNHAAHHITQQLAADYPYIWQYLSAAFADTPVLATEITRLHAELVGSRLNAANLAAAALATIAAHRDGERDPLSYLRDELRAQGYDANGSRR